MLLFFRSNLRYTYFGPQTIDNKNDTKNITTSVYLYNSSWIFIRGGSRFWIGRDSGLNGGLPSRIRRDYRCFHHRSKRFANWVFCFFLFRILVPPIGKHTHCICTCLHSCFIETFNTVGPKCGKNRYNVFPKLDTVIF